MDTQPPESSTPAFGGDDFVHIDDPYVMRLSESMARIDEPTDATVSPSRDASGSDHRMALPEELSRNVVVLTCESTAEGGVCDVYLVGTAHVSQESCREVQEIINFLKPQVVFLELCSSRVTVLAPQNLKVPTVGEMIEMLKKKQNIFGVIYSWFLAKIASTLEVFPGAEFRVAYEEAIKYGGRVILGDRPVEITIRRTWRKMPLWHKTKLLYSLLFEAVFVPSPEALNKMLKEMSDIDMLTLVIQEMSKEFPTLMETLVHERDQYMSTALLKVARECNSVVAVVGKGHLQGIKKHWKQPMVVGGHLFINVVVLHFREYAPCGPQGEGYLDNSVSQTCLGSQNPCICGCCRGWGSHYFGHLSFIQEMSYEVEILSSTEMRNCITIESSISLTNLVQATKIFWD